MKDCDIVISAWNGMWAGHLARGLAASGISSCLVGSSDTQGGTITAKDVFLSRLAMRYVGRFPEWIRTRLVRTSMSLFEKEAATYAKQGKIFWGWMGMNLIGLEKAKRHNRTAVVESGSTHAGWSSNILREEYRKHGMDYDRTLNAELIPKCLQEYETADFISIPSRFVARTFVENGIPESKLLINAFGVNHAFWHEATGRRVKTGRPFRFVYAGHLMLRKGLAYLLDAWRILDPKNAELWLVGGPHVTGTQLIQNLPPGTVYLGGKSHEELRDLYAQTDVYLLPSLEEGMARSVLEAMAAGLAVVITEETGATDVMVDQEDGWVIPARSTDALVETLRFCLQNPSRVSQCGHSGSQRVAPFSWEEYGKRAGKAAKMMLENR